jgi:nucleoid-associated protein YgaU
MVALLDNGEVLAETRADPQTGEFVFQPPRLGMGGHKLSLRSGASSDEAQAMENPFLAFTVAPRVRGAAVGNQTPSAPDAKSAARVAMTSARVSTATVARGDSLWRISRERLGRGVLYPTIFHANTEKIRDPNKIFPDQTLTIP